MLSLSRVAGHTHYVPLHFKSLRASSRREVNNTPIDLVLFEHYFSSHFVEQLTYKACQVYSVDFLSLKQ